MSEQREFFPTPKNLSRAQLNQLCSLAEEVKEETLADLLLRANQHVEQARQAHSRNPYINARMAEAIGKTIEAIATNWDSLLPDSQYWFRGAIQYFIHSDDSEPDFASIIGFDDDVEVLNSCLQLAGKRELCLKPEDYDNA